MKGLDISREFYNTYGKSMLQEHFCDVCDRIAAGLCGQGSECFGYDDEFSRDHDFDAGFCLWITKEDEERFGFRLERAYSKLPKEFMSLKRGLLSPVGGNRHGVMVIDDFYRRFLGAPTAPDSIERWLYTPSFALGCACNGEVFRDDLGEFSAVRNVLLQGYPEDIRRKKLAAHTVLMAQSGQYNYERCVKRGEIGAAQLAIFEFVKHAVSTVYLLNNKYEPFYKWSYKGMHDLEILGFIGDRLCEITQLDNTRENSQHKLEVISDISVLLSKEFEAQGLACQSTSDLEKCGYSIQNTIKDVNIRTLHIMDGI